MKSTRDATCHGVKDGVGVKRISPSEASDGPRELISSPQRSRLLQVSRSPSNKRSHTTHGHRGPLSQKNFVMTPEGQELRTDTGRKSSNQHSILQRQKFENFVFLWTENRVFVFVGAEKMHLANIRKRHTSPDSFQDRFMTVVDTSPHANTLGFLGMKEKQIELQTLPFLSV